MPYLECPSCRLTVYSAASYSTTDDCPRCETPLAREPRPLFARPTEESRNGADPVRSAATRAASEVVKRFERRPKTLGGRSAA